MTREMVVDANDSIVLDQMLLEKRFIFQLCLRFANKFEWGFTYWLAKDEAGWLTKEATRGIYDGSFFEYVEKSLKQRAVLKKKMK